MIFPKKMFASKMSNQRLSNKGTKILIRAWKSKNNSNTSPIKNLNDLSFHILF